MRMPRPAYAALPLFAAALAFAQSPTPKAQEAADAKALKSARATEDPASRLAALQQFLVAYPQSKLVSSAHFGILNALVKYFPDREPEIDKQARYVVSHSGKGDSRYYEQGFIASLLADRGPKPVDLPAAEKWARATADHAAKISEPQFDKKELKDYAKYKQPPPTAAALHSDYTSEQAQLLLPLADVLVHKGDAAQATSLLNRIDTLDASSDKASELHGVLALNRHDDPQALAAFEHAVVLGDLEARWRAKMLELYRQAHQGSDSGLPAELDAAYRRLYPAPTPAPKQARGAGHTVLLELFTGSACGPCIGGDVAVETALAAYPRSELVVLAFDQHIPEPDPLANPASEARAKAYNANSTPNYFLDGSKLPFYGGGRSEADELYTKLSIAIDKDAARPTGVQLTLTASPGPGGSLAAEAVVTLPAQLPPPPEASPAKTPSSIKPASQPTPSTASSEPPKLTLNFALVEDEVRYSGQNGVRFHRMVVRAMPAAQPLTLGRTASLQTSFNPQTVSQQLHTYLTDFETKNDTFGKVEFLSLDTTLNPRHLAIAAWVEDPATHRVLQAAFLPVPDEPATTARAAPATH